MWYVYVIQSATDDYRYIGSTNDLWRRLREHNQGLSQSTKAHRLVRLRRTSASFVWQAKFT